MKTQTLKTLIVDDEDHCRTALQRSIKQYCPQLKVVDSVNSVAKARVSIYHTAPDLIFLDVEMPEETGFDLLEQAGIKSVPVIFTTAHESYALRALKNRALDFLLKPIDGKELIAAVNKLDSPEGIEAVKPGKIALPTSKGLVFSNPEEIIRLKADGSYTTVFRLDDSFLVSYNLGHVEKLLSGYSFFRVHKSYLINLNHVNEYLRGSGGFAIMSDGEEVEVSKRKREDFLLAIS